jgi:hypothetical protein
MDKSTSLKPARYRRIELSFAVLVGFSILSACGGGSGGHDPQSSDSPATQTVAPVQSNPVNPPADPPKAVTLRMVFEYSEDVRNLYASASCLQYSRKVACALPTDVLNKTYVTIKTDSNAISDGVLTLSEISSANILLQLWPDQNDQKWQPGYVALEFKSDQSGLVAVRDERGWWLYDLASIKPAAASWCHDACDTTNSYTNHVHISQSWFGTFDVDSDEYWLGDSFKDNEQHMFLSGPFVDVSKPSGITP